MIAGPQGRLPLPSSTAAAVSLAWLVVPFPRTGVVQLWTLPLSPLAPDTTDVVGDKDHRGGEGPTATSGSDYTQTIQFISQLDPLYISLTVLLSPPTSPHTQSCSDGDTFHIH